MTTPLFPNDNAPVTIRQGNTGDCYLLASLDCIFNAGSHGYAKLKSLFTETEEGVTLRIKRTSLSQYLKPENVNKKYNYFYDTNTNEDVFIISQARLAEIDSPFNPGVRSNALAVKILERISAYYYTQDFNADLMLASVFAHNWSSRYEQSATKFTGQLLGVEAEDTSDFDKIIQIKHADPDQAVYISISWGEKDSYGNFHGYHALRLKRVVKNEHADGGYDFILANPHDNTKEVTFPLNELKSAKRNTRFCVFTIDAKKQQAEAQNMIDQHVHAIKNFSFSFKNIHKIKAVKHYRDDLKSLLRNQYLNAELSEATRILGVSGIHADIDAALSEQDKAIDKAKRRRVRLIRDSKNLIKNHIDRIEALPIRFEDQYCETAIEAQCDFLQQKLTLPAAEDNEKIARAQKALGYDEQHPKSVQAAVAQKAQHIIDAKAARLQFIKKNQDKINQALEKLQGVEIDFKGAGSIDAINARVNKYKQELSAICQTPEIDKAIKAVANQYSEQLAKKHENKMMEINRGAQIAQGHINKMNHALSKFDECLRNIYNQCPVLTEKAENNAKYTQAAEASWRIYEALHHNKQALLSQDIEIKDFQQNCKEVITNELDNVKTCPDARMQQFLYDILNAVLFIGCALNYMFTGQFRLFKATSPSVNVLQEAQEHVGQILVN